MSEDQNCKYCGKNHRKEGMPFTDCHDPTEPLPDSLEDGFTSKFGGYYDK